MRFVAGLGKPLIRLLLALLVIGFTAAVLQRASIEPQVDEELFFAEGDPALASDKAIAKRFGEQQQVLVVVRGSVSSASYLRYISGLSRRIQAIDGVYSVLSLSHGPGSYEAAAESIFWSRVLLPENREASNVIALFTGKQTAQTVAAIEALLSEAQAERFESFLSGVPYVIEASRRELSKDVIRFSIASVVVFSVLLLAFFRSGLSVGGAVLSCVATCAATLYAIFLLGIPVGVLTANFVAICFIVCVSHIVFLRHNFCASNNVRIAFRRTLPASLWAASTTAAGFATFLTVDAQPLREFGLTGLLATLIGLCCSYFIFPWFLTVGTAPASGDEPQWRVGTGARRLIVGSILLITALCLPGLLRLSTDASLLSYFDPTSEIHAGLAYADAAGGTSPLKLVVHSGMEETLASEEGFERLWNLQEALEAHPAVGSVISLPVIMAEANEHPLSFLLSWKRIVKILESERYQRIAANFITEDRRQGLFVLRMREQYQERPREQVLREVRDLVSRSGLALGELGGAYVLQEQIAKLVRSSLNTGLLQLIPLFFVLGVIAGMSIKAGVAVACCVAIVPVVLLGALTYLGIDVDLATVPAAAIAIALGVDQLFHLIAAVRRRKNESAESTELSWRQAQAEMRAPILRSLVVVACGAGISSLSSFPPIRMFGWLVLAGTVLAGLNALYVAPAIATFSLRRRASESSVDAK